MQPNENQPQAQPAPQAQPTFTPGVANSQPLPPAQEPAPQPAPQADPAPAPAPTPTPEPTPQPAPVEPGTQPAQNPVEPAKPVETKPQFNYNEYLDSLTKDIKPVEMPKATDVNHEDPDGLNKFFTELADKTVEKARQEFQKEQIIQTAESRAWQEVFTKYPEVQENTKLRDTIHNIRMGAYSRGESVSPVEAADALVGTLHNEYKKGINDTNVQTRVQASQPLNGGGNPQPTPAINYEALQEGGRDAAVMQLTQMINDGKI